MIGNTPLWKGSTIISGFGYAGPPNYFTPTYGQTVTVPATDTKLDSFTFYVDLPTNLIFRGEVYAWDPTTWTPPPPDAIDAEQCMRRAIGIAKEQGAKSWELRATTSLARLLRDTNRRDEARTMLADIYNWFTEGFDTADLKDAKALLEELGG